MITKVARQFYNETNKFGEADLPDGRHVWTNTHVILVGEPPTGLRDLLTQKGCGKTIKQSGITKHYHFWFTDPCITEFTRLDIVGVCHKVEPEKKVLPVLLQLQNEYREQVIVNKLYLDFILKTWPKAEFHMTGGNLSFLSVVNLGEIVGVLMPLNISVYSPEELEV